MFRWRSLTLQLIALILLPLTLLFLGVTFWSVSSHQHAMRDLVGERDERAARTASIALSQLLIEKANMLRSLSLWAGEEELHEEILTSSAFLLDEFDLGIAFLDEDGKVLTFHGEPAIWRNGQIPLEELALQTIITESQVVKISSPIPTSDASDFVIYVFAQPVEGGGMIAGAFSAYNFAHNTLASAFPASDKAGILLISQERKILYQVGSEAAEVESGIANHPGVASALRGESGTTYFHEHEGEHIAAFSPVAPVGWALVIQEPWDEIANPTVRFTQFAPLVLVPLVIVALLVLLFGVRQIVQPLRRLTDQAAAMAWGNYQDIQKPVSGIDEIQRLQHELIHMANKVSSAQESLRGYIGAITAGQEEERKRLARELHDDTLQALIALNQRVQLAILNAKGGQEENGLCEIQELTEQTIQDLRRFTRALRPLYLEDLGLVAALEMLTREISESAGLQVDFQLMGQVKRMHAPVELALYRMTQEALNNITRHADARTVKITLWFAEKVVELSIRDDGKGFQVPQSPAEFAPKGHYGLLGLHERADLMGAQLEIQSSPGKGTRVLVKVPLVGIGAGRERFDGPS